MSQRDQRDLGGEFVIALVALAVLVFAAIFGILLTLWSRGGADETVVMPTTDVAQLFETISVTQPTTQAPTEASPDVINTHAATVTLEVTSEISAELPDATDTLVVEVFTLPYTPTPTAVFTDTEVPPSDTPTSTSTPTVTESPTQTFTHTATATNTPSLTASPTDTLAPTKTSVPRVQPTVTTSDTPRPRPSPTQTSRPSATVTPSVTATRTPSATATETPSWTPSATSTWTPSATSTATTAPSRTPRPSPTATNTATSAHTLTPTVLPATSTPNATATFTETIEPAPTETIPPLPTLETLEPCVPPDDWILYTARFGETFELLSIAVDTPVETLLTANCRDGNSENETQLLAGDALYLPMLPRSARPPEREALIGCVDQETAYFENLEPGAVLQGDVILTGSVNTVNFWYAKIELRAVKDHDYRFVTRVRPAVINEPLATINTEDFEPGDYWLRLVVYNLRSQVPLTGVCVVPVTIRPAEDDAP
jgi:hypothetical protein